MMTMMSTLSSTKKVKGNPKRQRGDLNSVITGSSRSINAVFNLSQSFQRISTAAVVRNNRSAQTALMKCPSIDCVGERNNIKYAQQKLSPLFWSMATCKVSVMVI